METELNIPEELKPDGDGARLWAWLCSECDGMESARPLALELCRTADRLQEVRSKIASQGLMISGARGRSAKNPLLDIEVKLSKQFQGLWKGLGLSDKGVDETEKRPLGRPPAGNLWGG